MQPKKLERYRWFTLVSIGAGVLAVFFTYTLLKNLYQGNKDDLGERTRYYEAAVEDPSNI